MTDKDTFLLHPCDFVSDEPSFSISLSAKGDIEVNAIKSSFAATRLP